MTGALGGPDEVRTAWALLAGGAPTAANALVQIAAEGKSELARVQASNAILDRVGLAPVKEVKFSVMPSEHNEAAQIPAAEVIRNRLKQLSSAMSTEAAAQLDAASEPEDYAAAFASDEDEIVEAELLDNDGHVMDVAVPTEPESWS